MERKENCSSEGVLYYARILFVWVCLLGNVGHAVAKTFESGSGTPGTLPELVGKKAKYKVTDLTLKGTLNGRDLCFLREMPGGTKSGNPHWDVCARWTCGAFLLPVAEVGT